MPNIRKIRTFDDFMELFPRYKDLGKGKYETVCPACKNNTKPLHITYKNRRFTLHCTGGCLTENVVSAMGLTMDALSLNSGGFGEVDADWDKPRDNAESNEMTGKPQDVRQTITEQGTDNKPREAKIKTGTARSAREPKEVDRPQVEEQDIKQDGDKPAEEKALPRVIFALVDDKPYFQVDFKDGTYRFAYLSKGAIKFIDSIGDYLPQPLQVVNGKPLRFVLMPDGDVSNVKLYQPPDLFKRLKTHLTNYVDLSALDFELCIYYIIFTWFSRKVDTVGYLRLLGDTGKGKSRALKVIGDLVFYSIQCSGASTFSGIARTKEKYNGTLIIDEADIVGDASNTLIKYLNLGFERGKYFILSDKKNPRNQDIFDPYCPKVIAMRKPYEDNATEGRLLSIDMHETGNKHLPIILPDNYEAETQQLRNELCCFALHNWGNIDGHIMTNMTELNIEPRLKQLGMPLSIIFQLWPEGQERFIEYLLNRQKEIRRIRATSWDGTLVNTVIQLAMGEIDLPLEFDKYKLDGVPSAITSGMVAKIAGATAKSVTKQLAGCGFELDNKLCHVNGNKTMTVRAYQVTDSKTWYEILSRYYLNTDTAMPEIPNILRGKFYQNIADIANIAQKDMQTFTGDDPKIGNDGVSFMPKSAISAISAIEDGPSDDDPLETWEKELGIIIGSDPNERHIGYRPGAN